MQRLASILFCVMAGEAVAGAGDHIQVGPSEWVPYVELGFEAWSNAYRTPGERVGGLPEEFGTTFVFRPGLDIALESRRVRFEFGGQYQLRKFFQPELASDLDRFNDFTAHARLDVLHDGAVGFYVANKVTQRNNPQPVPNYDGSLLRRLLNRLEGGVNFRPGSGVEITPKFAWVYQDIGLPSRTGPTAFNNRSTLAPELDIHWNFLPNTQFVVEAGYERNNWADNWVESNGGELGEFIGLPDSDVYRGKTGIRGRITKHLFVTLMAGYGFANYLEDSVAEQGGDHPEVDPEGEGYGQNTSALHGILASVRFGFDFGYTNQQRFGQLVTLDYTKDFRDSFFTNYVAFNGLSAGLESRWGKFLSSNLALGVRFENFVGEVTRDDVFSTGEAKLHLHPARWAKVSAGVDWTQRASRQQIRNIEYDVFIGSVLATFTY